MKTPQLLTPRLLKQFKELPDQSQNKMEDIQIICHIFNPHGVGDWYLYEQDRDNPDMFWAFVNLGDPEMSEIGTVLLLELESLKLRQGYDTLLLELDKYYTPTSLLEIYNKTKGV